MKYPDSRCGKYDESHWDSLSRAVSINETVFIDDRYEDRRPLIMRISNVSTSYYRYHCYCLTVYTHVRILYFEHAHESRATRPAFQPAVVSYEARSREIFHAIPSIIEQT